MEANRTATIILLFAALLSSAAGLTLIQRQQQVPKAEQPTADLVTARTTSGQLRGIKQQTGHQAGAIIKFLSVPYAETPIRFRRAEELGPMRREQVLNASQYRKTCPQYRHLTQFISPLLNIDAEHQTSEDCLHLSIFVPANVGSINHLQDRQLEPNKQLPVIVWIPGEGFDFADARQFDGSNLALKTQSIVVTVQYRVGVLGFLHAPKLNITGNMGIYDQIMALKWIRKNIDQFGGDSERVTLMGRFSGSMSISAMITAPHHQELLKLDGRLLFQRVALLSGIAVDDWIIDSRQHERVTSLEEAALARKFCNEDQLRDGSCLSVIPVEQLMRIADYGWRLVKDNELIGEREPIEAVRSSSFASDLNGVMLGETGMEGTLCLYRHALDSRATNYAQLIDENRMTSHDLYNVIRDDSQTYFRYNPNKTNPIEMALGSLIESGTDDPEAPKLTEKYLNACSSYLIKSHSQRFKRNLLARNQQLDNRMDSSKRPTEVYHYELRYKPSFSLAPDYIKTAAHGDDIPLIFGLVYNQPRGEINEADLLMTRKMMSFIGNFVHGNHPLFVSGVQPSISVIESRFNTMDESDITDGQRQQQAPLASLAINIKARSWANEGQLQQIDFDETDLHELNARRKHLQQQQRQHQNPHQQVQPTNGSGCSDSNGHQDEMDARSSLRADKLVNIRQIIIDGINQLLSQQQDGSSMFIQQRNQLQTGQQRAQTQPLQAPQPQPQPQPQPPGQQTNMTLINESSFVTMLLFSCLVMFALIFTCLGLCVIIFRGSLSLVKTTREGTIQQHYVTSSTSSCNICEETQGGSIDAVLSGSRGKDARAFSNVFAKLRNNQASQSHHHAQAHQNQPGQPQHQHQPIDGQSRKQIE